MVIKQQAQAGTFESSDMLVLVEPVSEGTGRVIELHSPVMVQFGKSIKEEINNALDEYEIKDVRLICNDKGALSATISARVETAIRRALQIQDGVLPS
ncbi:MAG: citrate lyase acyl carrier protein [Bacteroidales bacterium]|nr:MAG: citrate lyase acyl carrier protein [Bacteroidales bacterium]